MSPSNHRPPTQRRFTLRMGGLVAMLCVVLATFAVLVIRTIGNLLEAHAELTHTWQVKEQIVATVAALRNTEAAQRAYAIAGDPEQLANAYAALPRILEEGARLRVLIANNPAQVDTARELEGTLTVRHELISRSLAIGQTSSTTMLPPAQLAIAKQQDMRVNALAARMVELEDLLLQQREASSRAVAARTRVLTVSAMLVCVALLALAAFLLRREHRRRADSEQRMAASHAELATSLDESRRLADTLHRLSELGHLLQGCRTLDEAAAGLRVTMATLFPATSGAVNLMHPSQNLLSRICDWGEPSTAQAAFAPDECWALRLGHAWPETDSTAPFTCEHLGSDANATDLCIPLFAQGTTIGTLQLSRSAELDRETRNAAVAAAEQVSLAIANLQLQETLRTQSLRDPLTGLFNRRYLEVSLARDLARAIRNSHALAVLMLDVDHFKRFNDQHGHDAGDALLAQFGELLATLSRSEDVVCRYGGEEFTIVLQEADSAIALDRAEDIRRNVEAMQVFHRQQSLGQVTVSIGIASYPMHGDTPVQLLRRADRALYASKNDGRNRVSVADRT